MYYGLIFFTNITINWMYRLQDKTYFFGISQTCLFKDGDCFIEGKVYFFPGLLTIPEIKGFLGWEEKGDFTLNGRVLGFFYPVAHRNGGLLGDRLAQHSGFHAVRARPARTDIGTGVWSSDDDDVVRVHRCCRYLCDGGCFR